MYGHVCSLTYAGKGFSRQREIMFDSLRATLTCFYKGRRPTEDNRYNEILLNNPRTDIGGATFICEDAVVVARHERRYKSKTQFEGTLTFSVNTTRKRTADKLSGMIEAGINTAMCSQD